MGGWTLQASYDLQGRLSNQSTKMQIRTGTFPSKCLSIGNRMPITFRWGKRLASGNYNQTNFARHSGSVEWTKYQRSSTSRSLHNLLPESYGIWEASAGTGASHECHRMKSNKFKQYQLMLLEDKMKKKQKSKIYNKQSEVWYILSNKLFFRPKQSYWIK